MEEDQERRLHKEKVEKYRGTFKIWLQHLLAEDEGINPRQTDPKNVARLLKIYQIDGCHRLDPQHYVPVVIEDERTYLTQSSSGSSSESPPFLQIDDDRKLKYLHGHHRLQAAKLFLSPADAWWTANLYSEDLSEENKCAIREDFLAASNFCDGDIYRHFRRCSLGNDPKAKTWLARLSESKRRDVLQLHKAAGKDGHMRRFRDSLDSLLAFPGLWQALHIGAFHRLLTLRCPEELAHYVSHIQAVWGYICDHDQAIESRLDAPTVERLQGRCPYYSLEDSHEIELAMAHRKIFPSVLSQHVRTGILGRLRNIKHLIPSLHTFLEDTKYIEPCVQIMKNILPKTHQGTVLEGFTKLHNGQETFHEQTTEAHIQATHEPANIAHWKSYRQLWLFAFRHFPEMTGSPPRKDIGKPRPSRPCIEHTWWHKIASLAQTFGYRNISTLFPQSEDADTRMTQQFLHHIRPTQYYQFDEGVFDAEVLRICSVLSKVQARQVEIERPYIASDRDASCGHDISFRCGRPFENAFIADRPFMFIRHIYSKHISLETRRFLSTFAVKRSIFHSFFGEPELCPGQLHSLEEEAPEDLQILSSDRLSSPVSPISWMKKGSTSTLEVQSHTTRAQGNVNESHDQSPDRLHETAPPVGTYIGQDRSASTGLVILRPLSPVHQGLFETDYVQWDQPSLLRSSLNIDSKKYIFLEPDRAKRLKSVPIADVIHPRNSPYSLIIQAHEGKVAEIRAKYENLSTRTIQAIYSGSIKKIS